MALPDGYKYQRNIAAYEAFKLYMSIPPYMRAMSSETLEQLGFTEEDIAIIQIRTRRAFCDRFDIAPATIIDWEKKPGFAAEVNDVARRGIHAKYMNTMAHRMAQTAIQKPNPMMFKAYQDYFREIGGMVEMTAPSQDIQIVELNPSTLPSQKEMLMLALMKLAEKKGPENVNIPDILAKMSKYLNQPKQVGPANSNMPEWMPAGAQPMEPVKAPVPIMTTKIDADALRARMIAKLENSGSAELLKKPTDGVKNTGEDA